LRPIISRLQKAIAATEALKGAPYVWLQVGEGGRGRRSRKAGVALATALTERDAYLTQ
jgi:hypothetical protein